MPYARHFSQNLPTRAQVLERTKHIKDVQLRNRCVSVMLSEGNYIYILALKASPSPAMHAHAHICVTLTTGDRAFASQSHQDWFVYRNFAAQHFDHVGVYLDIGANDPRSISNTWFFDQVGLFAFLSSSP